MVTATILAGGNPMRAKDGQVERTGRAPTAAVVASRPAGADGRCRSLALLEDRTVSPGFAVTGLTSSAFGVRSFVENQKLFLNR